MFLLLVVYDSTLSFQGGDVISWRQYCFIVSIFCIALAGIAAKMQINLSLSPCVLCELQRAIFIQIALLLAPGIIIKFSSFGAKLHSIFLLLLSSCGAALAGRQVWLQSLPAEQVPSCLGSFDVVLQNNGILEGLKKIIFNSSECAKIEFTILNVSLAQWSLVLFILIPILGLYVAFVKRERNIFR